MPRRMASKKQNTAPRKQTERGSKVGWLGFGGAALIAVAAAVYFWTARSTPVVDGPVEAQTVPAAAPAPVSTRHIYSETADPKADIAAGLAKAKRERKRVILDFGGDWCGDCQVLDIYFHQAPNAELLEKNFVLVHVWIGQMDTHLDIAAKYGVPISRGVPALAVLAADGKVLYSQASGEFAPMRRMQPESVTEFLDKWKN